MPIPVWASAQFMNWNDLNLLRLALSDDYLRSGYAIAVLQERQHRKRTYRRHKMLRQINKFCIRRRQGK